MIKNFLILFLTLILFSTSTVAENIKVFEFTDEEFKNLQVKKGQRRNQMDTWV